MKKYDLKKLVAMKNALIPAFARIGHGEKRFLAYCIAQLDPTKEKNLGLISFGAAHYADTFKLHLQHVYVELKEKSEELNRKSFVRYEHDGVAGDVWVVGWKYFDREGRIEIQLNERLAPLLLDLKNQYIQYALAHAKDFTNRGWSLYVVLKQWQKAGEKEFDLDTLKAALGLGGKFKRWYEFSREVVKPAVENINVVSDIEVSWEKVKKGRTVVGVSFVVSLKDPPRGGKLAHRDDDKTIDGHAATEKTDALLKALKAAGVHPKSAKRCVRDAIAAGMVEKILEKLQGFVADASSKRNSNAYLLGTLNKVNDVTERPRRPAAKQAAVREKCQRRVEFLREQIPLILDEGD